MMRLVARLPSHSHGSNENNESRQNSFFFFCNFRADTRIIRNWEALTFRPEGDEEERYPSYLILSHTVRLYPAYTVIACTLPW